MGKGAQTSPIRLCNRVEATNLLTPWVVSDEGDPTRNIDSAFFLGYFFFFRSDRLRTTATAVSDDIHNIAKECRMSVEVNFSVFGLVPLCIKQEVLRINKLLDFSSFESGAVRNRLARELAF